MIAARDVETIYEVPLVFHDEGLDQRVVEKLNIWTGAPNLAKWRRIVKTAQQPAHSATIAVVGKYVNLVDSYKSLHEAIAHGAIANDARVKIDYIEAEELEKGTRRRGSRTPTVLSSRAASATAASKAKSARCVARVKVGFQSSASAWACR